MRNNSTSRMSHGDPATSKLEQVSWKRLVLVGEESVETAPLPPLQLETSTLATSSGKELEASKGGQGLAHSVTWCSRLPGLQQQENMKEDSPSGSLVPISDSKSILKSELLSLLKTYNCYHEGRSFQLRHREELPVSPLVVEMVTVTRFSLRAQQEEKELCQALLSSAAEIWLQPHLPGFL
ncbi:Ras association domain-containing protein 4 [Fukomys damarensis]|uniref:Ras association domain-containing protein 4 n=1 Tax=Fukomys damarensis TaxID=885580 RepID=A0A091DTX8_FUKDA|nr:Ras association domain-containing protein 4 [Fukomys damarensis]